MSDQTPTTQLAEDRSVISYAGVGMEQTGGGGTLVPKNLGDVVAFAQVMAKGDLALPKHMRNQPGICMAVSMQAMRWEMDPFAVANKSYAVNDRLAYEAQLVAAVVHTRAPIKGRPNYIYSGEGPTRRCKVVCTMLDGETRDYESPTFAQITVKNSPLWKSDPDQQLGYFSIRSWARRHAPEVLLGVYTPDEVAEFRDAPSAPPVTSGVLARLEATKGATEGFSAHHGEAHDPETGEVTTATMDQVLDGDHIPTGEPADAIDAEVGPAEPEQVAEPATQAPAATEGPTTAQVAAMYEERLRGATNTTKLQSLRTANTKLRERLDAADPERLAELEDLFNERFAELEEAERGAGQ